MKTKQWIKFAPQITIFCIVQAVALIAVFATLQTIAPGLSHFREYFVDDFPTVLGILVTAALVTYVFKNL